jgi:hypothetical protein
MNAPALQVHWPDQPRLRGAFAFVCAASAAGVLAWWWASHERWGWEASAGLDGLAVLGLLLCLGAAWALPVYRPAASLRLRWDGQRWFLIQGDPKGATPEGGLGDTAPISDVQDCEAQVRAHLDAGLALWVSVTVRTGSPSGASSTWQGWAGLARWVLGGQRATQRHWRWVRVAPDAHGHALRCALYSPASTGTPRA